MDRDHNPPSTEGSHEVLRQPRGFRGEVIQWCGWKDGQQKTTDDRQQVITIAQPAPKKRPSH